MRKKKAKPAKGLKPNTDELTSRNRTPGLRAVATITKTLAQFNDADAEWVLYVARLRRLMGGR